MNKPVVIHKEELHIVLDYRNLEDFERGQLRGFLECLKQNPFRDAVRKNKRMYPERFLTLAEVVGASENPVKELREGQPNPE